MPEAAFIRASNNGPGSSLGSGPGNSPRSGARMLMIAALGLIAALAWALMLSMAAADQTAAAQISFGWAAMLAVMWAVMMFAMMLPTAAPAVLAYHDIAHAARAKGEKAASAPLFAAGYMAVWSLFGAVLAGAQTGLAALTGQTGMGAALPPAWGGAVLIAAGLYQLTPQKDVCLRECRSPLAFFIRHWREGRMGAFALGARHGVFCVGCCWALMAVMFAGGTMNIALMAVLTLVMGAEKLLPGVWPSRILALACICAGAALAASAAAQGG